MSTTHDADSKYLERDFLLLHVRALAARADYESFDFHAVHWARVQDRLWQFELDGAQASFAAFTASLMQCADLLREQRRNLFLHYERMYQEDVQQVRSVHDGTARLESAAQPTQLSAGDIARMAAISPLESQRRDVDALLAAFLD